MPVLEANKLGKRYVMGSTIVDALSQVDFVVEQGEFVAIMGPSGSGKSTLLHLIGGLDRPTEGEVTIAGQRLSLMKDKQITMLRRQQVGFVFQFFNLIPTLSARENINLPLIIDGANLAKYRERVETLLDMVGLADRQGHKPDQLSGGEQQRVALARALVHEPAIVLADEPTGNLDSKTGSAIMDLLRKSCDDLNQAIVIVTHDQRAAAYADRVVFLRDGKANREIKLNKDDSLQDKLQTIAPIMLSMEE